MPEKTFKVTESYFRSVAENFSEIERLVYMGRIAVDSERAHTAIEDAEKLAHKSWKAMVDQIGSESD